MWDSVQPLRRILHSRERLALDHILRIGAGEQIKRLAISDDLDAAGFFPSVARRREDGHDGQHDRRMSE